MLRLRSVLDRCERRELSKLEAAELLGIDERTFRRWCRRYREEGETGLMDRRLGKPSSKRVPVDEGMAVARLYRERYAGFTVKHFHEHLVEDHGFRWGYTWTKTFLHGQGLVRPAPRRGAHRRSRPRKPVPGLMLHQDGSRHEWLKGQPPLDLIVTMDDATSTIYSAFLIEEEGTFSSLRGLAETFAKHGLPCSLYTDRGSHYFVTPEAGKAVDRRALTQVGRALAQLGIEHIAAYSPEARGRSERMFGTLQDRLTKELALAGIASIEEANRFIAETYLPRHNRRFATPAREPGSAFVAIDRPLVEILCIQEERRVGNDNTVLYRRQRLQIPPSPLRPHFVKARVWVHHYPDHTLALFHGPRCLARYRPDGTLIEETRMAA